MKDKFVIGLMIALCFGLTIKAFAAQRMVVCEELYSGT
jgi:hypothetical protein